MLGKLSAAMGTTFDPSAVGPPQGDGEGPPEDEEEELDVHGAASAGEPKLTHKAALTRSLVSVMFVVLCL